MNKLFNRIIYLMGILSIFFGFLVMLLDNTTGLFLWDLESLLYSSPEDASSKQKTRINNNLITLFQSRDNSFGFEVNPFN